MPWQLHRSERKPHVKKCIELALTFLCVSHSSLLIFVLFQTYHTFLNPSRDIMLSSFKLPNRVEIPLSDVPDLGDNEDAMLVAASIGAESQSQP